MIINELFGENMLVFAIGVGVMLTGVVLIILACYTLLRFREQDNGIDKMCSRYRDALLYLEALINELEKANIKTITEVENLHNNVENLRNDVKRVEQSMERFAPPLDPTKKYKTVTLKGKVN